MKQWCDQNNISIYAYNYWKHQLKEEVVDQVLPDIVPLSLPTTEKPEITLTSENSSRSNCANRANSDPQVRISVNGIYIEVDPSVPEPFLFALIKASRYA